MGHLAQHKGRIFGKGKVAKHCFKPLGGDLLNQRRKHPFLILKVFVNRDLRHPSRGGYPVHAGAFVAVVQKNLEGTLQNLLALELGWGRRSRGHGQT